MDCNKLETNPKTDRDIDISDNIRGLKASSELSYSHHTIDQEPIKSFSPQELINESKLLVAQAETLMSKSKVIG
jgi:hypothetical protein